eukprot:PRCOL_00002386-RA
MPSQCAPLTLGDHSLVFCNGEAYADEHGLDKQRLSVAALSTAEDESEIGGEMLVSAPDGARAEEMCLWSKEGSTDGSNPTAHDRPTCRDVVAGEVYNGVVLWVDNKHQLSHFVATFGHHMSILEMSVSVATAEAAVPPGYVALPVAAGAVGIDRVDQRGPELDGQVTIPAHGGDGVVIFNIDTGIDCSHPEFLNAEGTASRCKAAFDRFANTDCINNGGSHPCTSALAYACAEGESGQQCAFDDHAEGHGTATAANAIGRTFGVARNADVRAVKVFTGAKGLGTVQDVLTGMNYVAAMRLLDPNTPFIAAMSLSADHKSVALNEGVEKLTKLNVTTAVPSGNHNLSNACNFSPGSSPAGITVSSIDAFTDRVSDFANVGDCVTLFAVGAAVASAQPGGGSTKLSGTSFAVPVVVGIVALYLGEFVAAGAPVPDPARVKADMILAATDGAIPDPMGSPNKVAYAVFAQTGVTLPPDSASGGAPPMHTPQPSTSQPQLAPIALPTTDESYRCTQSDCNDSTAHKWGTNFDRSWKLCYCDYQCLVHLDCCENREAICGAQPEGFEEEDDGGGGTVIDGDQPSAHGTCATLGSCGEVVTKQGGEQCGCDTLCVAYDDCCEDFWSYCESSDIAP